MDTQDTGHHVDLPDMARKERREPEQRTRADIEGKIYFFFDFEQTDANTSRSVRYLRGSSLLGGAFFAPA